MKDARWIGVGLLVVAGALDGCGVDHVVGSGTSGAAATAAASGAGFNGIGGASGIGGKGGGLDDAGSSLGGTGGAAGANGGTPGTGGAAMAGTGGNGTVGNGGSAGTAAGEGGAAGAEGGAGPEPVQCASTTVRGTLTDSTGSTNIVSIPSPQTITDIIDHLDSVSPSREFVLRTADDAEWHYNVTLPCLHLGPLPVGLAPEIGVQVGDSVDVKIVGGMTNFFFDHQEIVMTHDGKLVLFTVDEAELDFPTPPDLSPYGFELSFEPTDSGVPSGCSGPRPDIKDLFERLVVSGDSETVRVEASQTFLVGGFTFSVGELTHATNDGGGGCDPWGWSRYGGFLMQP